MSTISAGTTTTTALVSTGDTSGNLALQTNGGTTALTLNTSGAIGVGSSPAYGSSGQVLTSAGSGASPTWTTISAGAGVSVYSNVTTATTYTLTSASNPTIEIDAQAYGIKVVLPNATTLSAKSAAFIVRNTGSYPIIIEDATNVALGGVPATFEVPCNLNDASTSAGSWRLGNAASYATEVAYLQIGITSINRIERMSSTKFYVVGGSSGSTISIQAYTLSGDTVTAGTVTSIDSTGSYYEARAIDSSRVLVSYTNGSTLHSNIVDISDINSPVVGSQADVSTPYDFQGTSFRFDSYPTNDYRYYDSQLTYSGRLTGTNTFVYSWIQSSSYELILNSIDVGSSGTTITVGTPKLVTGLTTASSNSLWYASVISSNSIGLVINVNPSSASLYGITASLSGGVWSYNTTSILSGINLNSSVYMRWSNRSCVFATRTATNGVYAVEFPSSGNTAPTVLSVGYGGVNTPQTISKVAEGIILGNSTLNTISCYSYSLGVAPNWLGDFDSAGPSGGQTVFSQSDTDVTPYVGLYATSGNMYTLTGIVSGVAKTLYIGSTSSTKPTAFVFGFPSSATNAIIGSSWTDSSVSNAVLNLSRRTVSSSTFLSTPTKQIGLTYGVRLGVQGRYFSTLGKYILGVSNGQNTMFVPVSSSGTATAMGNYGAATLNLANYLTSYSCDVSSSHFVVLRGNNQIDEVYGDNNTATAVLRLSVLRIAANT